jgi:hypothetical protein
MNVEVPRQIEGKFRLESAIVAGILARGIWHDSITADDFDNQLLREFIREAGRDETLRSYENWNVRLLGAGRIHDCEFFAMLDSDGAVPCASVEGLRAAVRELQRIRRQRKLARDAEELSDAARLGNFDDVKRLHELVGAGMEEPADTKTAITSLGDIGDMMTADLKAPSWICEGILGEKWIATWIGAPKTGKSILMTHLAEAISRGGWFLERRCQQRPVLVLDFEMDPRFVRQRRELMGYGPNPKLFWWHRGLPQRVPGIMDPALLQLIQKEQPFFIIDPFRYAHDADENDSNEMTPIMKRLNQFAALSAGGVAVHHSNKADPRSGRGSSAIFAATDIEIAQQQDGSGLITISCDRPRYVASWTVTMRLNSETLALEISDAPQLRAETAKIETLDQVIRQHPGHGINELARQTGMRRATVSSLVKTTGRWEVRDGANRSKGVYPSQVGQVEQVVPGGSRYHLEVGQVVHTPIRGVPVPPEPYQQTDDLPNFAYGFDMSINDRALYASHYHEIQLSKIRCHYGSVEAFIELALSGTGEA